MHITVSKRGGLSRIDLSAERAQHVKPSASIEILIEGHLGSASGVDLRQANDAHVLADLYAAHGASGLEEVDGSFAFIIVDHQRGLVHVGIDKLGQSFAYLAVTADSVHFATTLLELLNSLPSKPNLDLASVYEFLAQGWIIAPNSMFEGIEKLQPGSYVTWDGTELHRVGYYKPPHDGVFVNSSRERLNTEVREHLDAAVRRGVAWCDSWSSFLSGGLDSSSVVYALSNILEHSFPTFYASFGSLDRYMALPDEERVARKVAARFSTEHDVLTLQPNLMDRVPEIIRIIEEPIYDGGPIVVDAVMAAAKKKANGVMTGIGGDFLFGGERRHLLISLLDRTQHLPGWTLVELLSRLPTGRSAALTRLRFDVQRMVSIRNLSMGEFYVRRLHGSALAERLFKPEILHEVSRSPLDKINACLDEVATLDDLSRLLYLDFRLLTPDGLTRDVVALGRAHDLTICNPYLDSEFVDFSMRMPPREKVRRLTQKYALRQAMRDCLPPEVLKKKKGGLGAPIRWWVTHDGFVAEHFSREVLEERGLFDFKEVERMRLDTISERRDYSLMLWSLFTLESWMRHFVDELGPPTSPTPKPYPR
jgi:asparagine synthase (glutamine-hydrolysing)